MTKTAVYLNTGQVDGRRLLSKIVWMIARSFSANLWAHLTERQPKRAATRAAASMLPFFKFRNKQKKKPLVMALTERHRARI
jgi:hypothetical protein